MPLSRLENFLVNTDGNILYVNPSDLDATDSFDNKGNSLTRPFVTIQRALIEAARFTYQSGFNNDRFDRTTVLVYPGEHVIDNRPGLGIKDKPIEGLKYVKANGQEISANTADIELNNNSSFNLNDVDNVLRKYNSVYGGVIVPKGTSIVGLDLRKTKIRPLYVPNPDVLDSVIPRSAVFRVTGGCYFWQFSMFDANRSVYYSTDFTEKRNPNISHHKLTCFEYADGQNVVPGYDTTDLQQYYFKLMNAYGSNTGNRIIPPFPSNKDFEPNTPESKIVGDLSSDDNAIKELTSSGLNATALTENPHGLTVDDQILITGVGSTDLYNGTYRVTGIGSDRQFSYQLNGDAIDDTVSDTNLSGARVIIEADTVTGASPYIFNCSLRSVFGMCGLHADGSKATGFKSMVVAQFTGIGLQKDDNAFVIYNKDTGDYLNSANARASGLSKTPLYLNPDSQYRKRYDNFHVKVSNDAFIQAVSVFAIGFSNHFLAESGGEQSITNSNSNFGNKALVSKGFKPNAFNRDDTGYVTHIVPPKDLQKEETNIVWRVLDPIKTKNVGISSHLYIAGENDVTNPPTSIINGYRIGARKDDKLYLNVNINGTLSTLSSPILMDVGDGNGDGPVSEKKFTVGRVGVANSITSNVISLTTNHNFLNGESVRVFADDGRTPDGIELGRKYFAITTGLAADEIKLANTVNDALSDKPITDNINTKGGILTVQSIVNDKIPGEIGHPIQYDTTQNQWYILGSASLTLNTIYNEFRDATTANNIAENNSSTYVLRKSETRALNDRIYRLRYVIPKDFSGANTAKKPEKNYVLQESKSVEVDDNFVNVISNRNPKVIADITSSTDVVTVTSALPHKLSVNDIVKIKNVRSSTNITGVGNSGFNGKFRVTGTPTSKTFTFGNSTTTGTFTNTIADAFAGANNLQLSDLPVFERNEYDTTYTVQEVETIQDYISNEQDGIYYLTCLIGNLSPTVSEFSDLKFKQSLPNLYPTVDKDNPVSDPVQCVTAASNENLGKVILNNPLNSITKEATINYVRDNRVGFAVTGATSGNSGTTTLITDVEHNLNAITNLSITSPTGTGYGSAGTKYNVPLTDEDGGSSGQGATANITVDAGGRVTAIQIVDGGSAYVGLTTLAIGGGTGGVATVAGINNCVGNVIQVIGVGSVDDRTNGGFNGLYKITGVPSTKSVTYTHVAKGQTTGTSAGIYTGPVSATSGIFTLLDEAVGISNVVGVAGTTLSGIVTVTTSSNHNLAVGNKIKFAGLTGNTSSIYNGSDFIVREIVGVTTFTMKAPIGISTDESGEIYKYSLNSFGQDTSLASEKIAGTLSPLLTGISSKINNTNGIGVPNTVSSGELYGSTTIRLESTIGFNVGDFVQIGNEIVRIKSKNVDNLRFDGYRGVLGTQSVAHSKGELVRKINVIPSELHRFSSIRASGHTFEYIGYGPGNYSTSLPQKITKQIEPENELLAISREEKGGVTFFSGMNDRGDFFSGQKEEPKELFLGDAGDTNFAIFDDVFIRNTLRVGGGPAQNLPSEFNGPVNFTKKVTSTDFEDGIEAIKLLVKGTGTINPLFQVGDDTSPSLIVNQASTNVGINTLNPNTDIALDVDGTIRANVYENFKLTDLPDATEEPTYARNRIIKVKDDGSGYEMIDPHDLKTSELRSLGVSNDGTIYIGTGANASGKFRISGISTSKFFVGERVKMFGVTAYVSGNPDPVEVQDPVLSGPTESEHVKIVRVPSSGFSTARTYYYWQAQYDMKNGKVGIATQITGETSGSYALFDGKDPRKGVANAELKDFNDATHNVLKLRRSNVDNGILIYRQIYTHPLGNNATLFQKEARANANVNDAKLIAVLGQKELKNATTGISWIDYGVYEQPFWTAKGTVNEFLGSDTSTVETEQIHFPTVVSTITSSKRKGWDIAEVTNIGNGNIRVAGNFSTNSGDSVKVVHDNTKALSDAVTRTVANGGNYLSLPSGTYLTNKLLIPDKFTLKGVGKNSIIKQQYYATDATDQGTSGGTALGFDGNLIGNPSSVSNPSDITIADITFDGNSSNNIMFELDNENNLMSFENGTSMLFKDMEIRNSSGGGLYARNSRRISIENCTIVDGGQTDRYPIRPLDVQNSETVRVNDCLFENFAGPLDVSATTVVSTGGNIIRNCGSGIDAYATGKITTTSNVILGPADEFIASPDIYDTDFDSINISIDAGEDFYSPALLYLEDGEGKDLTGVDIVAGIGTMVGLYSTNRIATLGEFFYDLDWITQSAVSDTENTSPDFTKEGGYIELYSNSSKTTNLEQYKHPVGGGVTNSDLGYQIIGTEYRQIPIGLSTSVGITSGYWAGRVGGTTKEYIDIPNNTTTGIACTQYILRLSDSNQISRITIGDIVKLPGHTSTPDISDGLKKNKQTGISTDENGNDISEDIGLRVDEKIGSDRIVLSGFRVDALSHGSDANNQDYISIRRIFTIAKGRVGVY